jgi:predicted membrane protein
VNRVLLKEPASGQSEFYLKARKPTNRMYQISRTQLAKRPSILMALVLLRCLMMDWGRFYKTVSAEIYK